MLSNTLINGLDLLSLMTTKAADHATAQLGAAIYLSNCESWELTGALLLADVEMESWVVRTEQQKVVVAVFANAPHQNGGRSRAASGRFTFTRAPRLEHCRS